MIKWDSSHGCKYGKIFTKQKTIHHIKKRKDENHMIILIDAEKYLKYSLTHEKNGQQSGSRVSIPQHDKGHIRETHSHKSTLWAKIYIFTTEIRKKTRVYAFTTFIQHSIGILATAIRQEK